MYSTANIPLLRVAASPYDWCIIFENLKRHYRDHNMKANFLNRFFAGISIVAALSFSAPFNAMADDKVEQPLSQLGIDRGLELYDRDVADKCVPDSLQIRTVINGVTKKGLVKVELFGEKDFMKKSGKLRRIRVPAEDKSVMVCINVPAPGLYAISSYHDRNGDRKFDKSWNFKPKEPYGLSNNPKIETLRLPKWSETNFDVPLTGADITINLVDLKKKG